MPQAAGGITYLDGPRLIRSLRAGADWVDAGRDELNRINVFPVPDGDTGTNFALTLRSVSDAVRNLHNTTLPAVSDVMAETCVFAARGNSGMLLSHFLVGFREALGERLSIDARELARAIGIGAEHLYQGLDEPVEGTILTVCRETAAAAQRAAGLTDNIQELMHRALSQARTTLARTPEMLHCLREAGVVDAGGMGFVRLIEGIVKLMEGDPILAAPPERSFAAPYAAARAQVAEERDYGFCTEVLVRGGALPPSTRVRQELRQCGGSIVVLGSGNLLKVHIHTDQPEQIFALAATWGTVEATKADDMREQHRELHDAQAEIALVVDSSCDLSDEIVDRYRMVVVPIQVMHGEETYLDRLELGGDELYRRMSEEGHVFTTSQPTPGAFAEGFRDAGDHGREILAVLLSAGLSGTFASAQAAARALSSNVTLVDSRSVSMGLGMLALRGAELAGEGWAVDQIAAELERIRGQSGGLFTVDTFDNLLRSGRVSRGRAWLGELLNIKPILEINGEGRVVPLDRVRGQEALLGRVLDHLDRRLASGPRSLRMAVVHARAEGVAKEIRTELVSRYAPKECFLGAVTAALGVHAGPGAWGVFYQIED